MVANIIEECPGYILFPFFTLRVFVPLGKFDLLSHKMVSTAALILKYSPWNSGEPIISTEFPSLISSFSTATLQLNSSSLWRSCLLQSVSLPNSWKILQVLH